MNPVLEKTTSQITSGFYTIAIFVIILSILSVIAGKTLGGKNKRKQLATTKIIFAIGIVIFSVIFLPRMFGAGA